MKNECNVARDLMPLVIDGVASEESQRYVDDHIAECTECAVTYGSMKVELPRINAEKERAEMEKAAKKLRRRRIRRGIAGALAGIAIFMACYIGVPRLLAWYEKAQFMEKYVCENGDLRLEGLYYDVSQGTETSRVQVDVFSFPCGGPNFQFVTDVVTVNDGTAVCIQHRAVYQEEDGDGVSDGVYSWYGLIVDGEWLAYADDVRDENGHLMQLPIVRIELYAGDDFVVLWEEGDVLQTPAEAKAKREAEEAKYADK